MLFSARAQASTYAISGTVYADLNHDGTLTSGETWNSGITGNANDVAVYVGLYINGTYVRTATVAAKSAGTYSLPTGNITSGSTYEVLVCATTPCNTSAAAPSGWLAMQNAGGVTGTVSANITGVNFGFYPGFTYSGTIFLDNGVGGGTAANGVQDGGELDMSGVTVKLIWTGQAGNNETVTTDAYGNFTFYVLGNATTLNISCANFTSTVTGYMSSYTCPNGGAGTISGGSFSGGVIFATSVAYGTTNTGAYFAMGGGPAVSGAFFLDNGGGNYNSNGTKDSGEAAFTAFAATINVTLYTSGGTVVATFPIYSSTSNGAFSFTIPPVGGYALLSLPTAQFSNATTGMPIYRIISNGNQQSCTVTGTYPSATESGTCIGDEIPIPFTYSDATYLSFWNDSIFKTQTINSGISGILFGLTPVNTVTTYSASPQTPDSPVGSYVYTGYKYTAKNHGRIFWEPLNGISPRVWKDTACTGLWTTSMADANQATTGGNGGNGEILLDNAGTNGGVPYECVILRDLAPTSSSTPATTTAFFQYSTATNNPWIADTFVGSNATGGVTVSGTVFVDNGAGSGVAANGTQDGTEAGYTGNAISYSYTYRSTAYNGTTTTDSSGNFNISIPQGSTSIVVTRATASGYMATGGATVTNWTYAKGAVPSAADTYTYTGSALTVSITGLKFGIEPYSTLNGLVFVDNGAGSGTGGNGVQDGSEAAYTATSLSIGISYKPLNGTTVTATPVVTSTTNGTYTAYIPGTVTNLVITRAALTSYIGTSASESGASATGTFASGGSGAADTYTFATFAGGTTVTGPNFGIIKTGTITGTVFQDSGYTGGSGRSLVTSGGTGVSGVTVELYKYNGSTYSYSSSATTDSSGMYSFTGQTVSTNYIVRVVNSTVVPTTGLLGVQTYRTSAGAVDTARVGGEKPSVADAATAASGATITTAGVISTVGQANSISPVSLGTTAATDVDFGFAFNVIVNTNDSGQGSLRQFITNANVLGNITSEFMIPDGNAHNGLRSGLTSQVTSGVATISIASTLPTIAASSVVLDGSTQGTNVTANAVTLYSGGVVGRNSTSISSIAGPSVEITSTSTTQYVLTTTGTSDIINGLDFYLVALNVSGSSSVVSYNAVGMPANGGSIGTMLTNVGIEIGLGSGIKVMHNYVKANNSGIRRDGSGSSLTITQNAVDSPGTQSNTFDGILLVGPGTGSGDIISQNYVANMQGGGIEIGFSGTLTETGLVIDSNTVTYNGYTSSTHATASTEPINIGMWGVGTGSSVTVSNNLVTHAGGVGLLLEQSYGVTITQNSFDLNGVGASPTGPGIQLSTSTTDPNTFGSAPVTTGNTGVINTGLPNSGMNYPVFTATTVDPTANTLHVKGYIGKAAAAAAFAGSTIELFIADNNDANQNGPINNGDGLSVAHGEGKTYIATITADSTGAFDATISNASGMGVTNGTLLSATATLSGDGTSEFGADSTVSLATSVSGSLYVDVDHSGTLNGSPAESWASTTGVGTFYVNLLSGTTVKASVAVAAASTGSFTITDVPAGTYTLIVSSTAAGTTVAAPTGYVPTAPTTETYSFTIATSPAAVSAQNFGFYAGSVVKGYVFIDNGAGSGTANDGIKNGTEAGYTAAALTMPVSYTISGTVTNTTVTSSATDGSYSVYIPGTVTASNVVITRPFISGYASTKATATPAGTYVSGGSTGNDTYTFTSLSAGTTVAGPYFGIFQGMAISGKVFIDDGTGTGGIADNGIQEANELAYTALAQTITLGYTLSGTATQVSVTTDATGSFSFTLPSGVTAVSVTRAALANYIGTGGSAGTPTGGTYSKGVTPTAVDTVTFATTPTASVSGILFGIAPYSTISGSVFVDTGTGTGGIAMNGVRETGELGYLTSLAIGVSYIPTGASSATTTTVSTSTTDGTFVLYVPAAVTNLVLTRPAITGYMGSPSTVVTGVTGATYVTNGADLTDTLTIATLAKGTTVTGPAFGVTPYASFSGVVFVDNGAGTGGIADDGVMQSGESGYTTALTIGISYLLNGSTTATTATVTSSATNGTFTFKVPAAVNTLVFTRPAVTGYVGTGAMVTGATGVFASGGNSLADTETIATLTTGGSITGPNFGMVKFSTLSGVVFLDNGVGTGGVANDGTQNGTEQGTAIATPLSISYTPVGGTAGTTTATVASNGTFTFTVPGPVSALSITRPGVASYVGTGATITSGATGTFTRGGAGSSDVLTFTLSSSLAAGSTVSGIDLGVVAVNTLTVGTILQGAASTTVLFPHAYVANSAGNVTFSTSNVSTPTNASWSAVVYYDKTFPTTCSSTYSTNFALTSSVSGGIPVVNGTQICLLVAAQVPVGASGSDVVTLNSSVTYTNASPTMTLTVPTATDTVTVGLANVTINKTTTATTVYPGNTIPYVITINNAGTMVASTVVINDSTPANTTFISASCPATLPTGITACSVTAPAVGGIGAITWILTGTLNVNATLTLGYSVKVN